MKKILSVILLFYFSFFSCTKRLCGCTPIGPPVIKAVVTQVNNIDCNRPVIVIDPTDTAMVSRITGIYTDMYVASQIPAQLKIVSQKLYIDVGVFLAGEDFACTTLGPLYPHIKVTTAINRN